MSNLEKKNIIVTGASGGIGNSIIKKFNEAGANILATGTRIEKLEELKSRAMNLEVRVDTFSADELVMGFNLKA